MADLQLILLLPPLKCWDGRCTRYMISYLTLKCFYFLLFKKMFRGCGVELKTCFPQILKKSSEMDSEFPWIAT